MANTDFTPVDVLRAKRALLGSVERTPLTHSRALSELSGAEVHLKWENLQRTGSYKDRGALYRMNLLSTEERRAGVITTSTGNWALGVALGGRRMGIEVTICVPANTPEVKVSNCRALGAEVVLHGSYFDQALARCEELVEETRKTFLSGTDDVQVMAGHGTVGLEVFEDLPDTETIVCPVGDGGLLSGIAVWARAVNPGIKIIGVQSTAAHTLHECFRARNLVEVPVLPTICEGLAGGISQMNLSLALRWFDDIVLADEEEIEGAIRWLMRSERQIVEGSAAVGPAAILQKKLTFKRGERVAVVVSGGNLDLDRVGIAGS